MDTFGIALGGRWRGAAGHPEGAVAGPLDLRDHLAFRLGDRSLSAHLADEAVAPFLLALGNALATPQLEARIAIRLPASAHELRVRLAAEQAWLTLASDEGRAIVRDAPLSRNGLASEIGSLCGRFAREVAEECPEWAGAQPLLELLALEQALTVRAEGTGESNAASAPPPAVPIRRRRTGRPAFPLTIGGGALRFGGQPATGSASLILPGPLPRLVEAIETIARDPTLRATVPWSSAPRTVLALERAPDGDLAWQLSDGVGAWVTGRCTLERALRALAVVAKTRPQDERAAATDRLRRARAWARAAALPPLKGAALHLPPPEPEPEIAEDAPSPFAVHRLYRVAFRKLWRRALRRFHLPPQDFGGAPLVVQTADGLQGLCADTGRTQWRAEGLHPVAPGGPALLVQDDRGRLLSLDGESGAVRWRTARRWAAAPAVAAVSDRRGVVLATEAGELVSVEPGGQIAFSTRLASGAAIGLTLSPALVWVLGEDRHVYGFRRGDGALHFRMPVDGHAAGPPLWTPAGLVVVSDRGASGALGIFDPATGERRAELALPGPVQTVTRLGPLAPEALAVLIQTGENTVVAVVDLRRARIRYAIENQPWRSSLTSSGGALFLGAHGGSVRAFDAATGEPLWTARGEEGDDDHPTNVRPLAARGLLYVVGQVLRVLDPAEGRLLAQVPLDGLDVGAWAVTASGDVLLADPERALLSMRLSGHLARVD